MIRVMKASSRIKQDREKIGTTSLRDSSLEMCDLNYRVLWVESWIEWVKSWKHQQFLKSLCFILFES